MCFRLAPKSSTLDDLNGQNALYCRKDAYFGPTAQIWMKVHPYYQRPKCTPMTLVSGNIRCTRIFGVVPLGRGIKWEWDCRRRQFLAIWVATSMETSEIRPAILCDDMLPPVGLWLIAKLMTFLTQCLTLKNNCVKSNKHRPMLPEAEM